MLLVFAEAVFYPMLLVFAVSSAWNTVPKAPHLTGLLTLSSLTFSVASSERPSLPDLNEAHPHYLPGLTVHFMHSTCHNL